MATTIDFPPEIEEQLVQLATRTGQPKHQLIQDAAKAMLRTEQSPRPRP